MEPQANRIVSGAVMKLKELEENRNEFSDALTLTGSTNVLIHKVMDNLEETMENMVAKRNIFRERFEDVDGILSHEDADGHLHLHCQGFDDRRAAIEASLDKVEKFMEDCSCWNAYRTLQMHEQLGKIQECLTEGRKKQTGAMP